MTREDAIEYWERFNAEIDDLYDTCSDTERDVLVKQREAVEFTISALRQQETVTNRNGLNAPLTLDELREMNGEPVYIVSGDVSWLDIVGHSSNYLILRSGEALPYKRYGEWLAFRQKPEEDKHENYT